MIMVVTLISLGVLDVLSILCSIVFGKASNIQSAFTCLKLTIETLEQGVKSVQS